MSIFVDQLKAMWDRLAAMNAKKKEPMAVVGPRIWSDDDTGEPVCIECKFCDWAVDTRKDSRAALIAYLCHAKEHHITLGIILRPGEKVKKGGEER